MKKMRKIDHIKELKNLVFDQERRFYIYGAGFQAEKLISNLEFYNSLKVCIANIKNILVTNKKGNPDKLRNIPVIQYDRTVCSDKDFIIIAVDDSIKDEIADYLKDCKAELIDLDFDCMAYNDIYQKIRPFIDKFPNNLAGINQPSAYNEERIVWTCWWQGEEDAPDIIKACWESQRRNLPPNVKHIIITKDNYADFITIPDYLLNKFQNGKNRIAHLSDFIRMSLLYKYGGVWLDAAVWLLEELPEECWTLPLYTWRFDMTLFASKTLWILGFLAARQGSVLCQFVMEAFLYYFSVYDKIDYYLTTDCFISIGTNVLDGVLEQFKQIPYNNEMARRLINHLDEPYSEEKFCECCNGSFLQSITWHRNDYNKESIYNHLINFFKS